MFKCYQAGKPTVLVTEFGVIECQIPLGMSFVYVPGTSTLYCKVIGGKIWSCGITNTNRRCRVLRAFLELGDNFFGAYLSLKPRSLITFEPEREKEDEQAQVQDLVDTVRERDALKRSCAKPSARHRS